MFLVTVRSPSFERHLPASGPREALQALWMFAGQDFEISVRDLCGQPVSLRELEALATCAPNRKALLAGAECQPAAHP